VVGGWCWFQVSEGRRYGLLSPKSDTSHSVTRLFPAFSSPYVGPWVPELVVVVLSIASLPPALPSLSHSFFWIDMSSETLGMVFAIMN